ncbi:hypothetical protein CIPAW_13G001400 [Carya illinoinensis]|uniref:Reverse transcriptase zinc-binding domain-containing protein n=1 Tax=Carya illinoinensis TaxID=32201 RepID=A0A8T1NF08_CARIL|nr:hypothetical protein CIPAW_13G001400 [Carya illinoinensis]
MFKRKVTDNETCPICKQLMETNNHVLWSCSAAQDVWGDSDIFLQKATCVETNFHVTWEELIDRLNDTELELATCVFRKLWLRRNRWVFEDAFDSPRKLWQGAKTYLEEFKQARGPARDSITSPSVTRSLAKWSRPEEDWVKVNWDATYSDSCRKMGGGCVFRNCNGDLLAATT